MRPIQKVMPPLLDHERRVREMMSGFGQAVPDLPTVADTATRRLRSRLLVEEVFEYVEAAGFAVMLEVQPGLFVRVRHGGLAFEPVQAPDLPKMMDAVADISVVNCGTAAAHGTRLAPILEAVDSANMAKIANGHLDAGGKFIKPANHQPPNIEFMLQLQGWQPNDEARECNAVTEPTRGG